MTPSLPDTIQHASTILANGRPGIPVPYLLQTDNGIAIIVLAYFFILAYVLSGGKRYLFLQIKNILYTRRRSNLFTEETNIHFGYRLLLVVNTCLISSLLVFDHQASTSLPPMPGSSIPRLGLYAGMFLAYYILKYLLYDFVNWIFFDREQTKLWHTSFFLLFALFGIALFPVALLSIYFDLSNQVMLLVVGIYFVLEKIILFYKCTNIFFSNLYRTFYLILYFCSLEIVPCFLLWQTLVRINSL